MNLLTRLQFLRLKKFIEDNNKISNIEKELNSLNSTLNNWESLTKEFNLIQNLLETNTKLWKIEDEIRELERNKNFG